MIGKSRKSRPMDENRSRGSLFSTQASFPRWKKWSLILLVVVVVGFGGMYAGIYVWPSIGGHGTQVLRGIFGNRFVAELEMFVFNLQDAVQSWVYAAGLAEPSAPWEVPVGQTLFPEITPTPAEGETTLTPIVLMENQVSMVGESPVTSTLSISTPAVLTPEPEDDPRPTPTSTPETPTVEPLQWPPEALTPFGSLEGEGLWSPYIEDSDQRTVAYRAFLQPDTERPYTLIGVVAFDLTHTRLNYMLGFIEPRSPEGDGSKRSGKIPDEDRVPGKLLAAFNGGFQAQHGLFGAMSGGILALPPVDGLGTVVIYKSGEVSIGVWGEEITDSPEIQALRQNGPLVVHNGELTPHVFSFSPKDWGYTLTDVSPTWRSGLAIDPSQQVLFYLAGPSLTVEALGNSMIASGAINGIQLDINTYWVHFTTFQVEDGNLAPVALFPDTMNEFVDRYLQPYSHDYFYVTALDEE
jgi:hypothetical protein